MEKEEKEKGKKAVEKQRRSMVCVTTVAYTVIELVPAGKRTKKWRREKEKENQTHFRCLEVKAVEDT